MDRNSQAELLAAGRRDRGHPGDGAVEPGKPHSSDPEAAFNAVLPVFHLCCMLFFGNLVFFWEKKVLVLNLEHIPVWYIMAFPDIQPYAFDGDDASA